MPNDRLIYAPTRAVVEPLDLTEKDVWKGLIQFI